MGSSRYASGTYEKDQYVGAAMKTYECAQCRGSIPVGEENYLCQLILPARSAVRWPQVVRSWREHTVCHEGRREQERLVKHG